MDFVAAKFSDFKTQIFIFKIDSNGIEFLPYFNLKLIKLRGDKSFTIKTYIFVKNGSKN